MSQSLGAGSPMGPGKSRLLSCPHIAFRPASLCAPACARSCTVGIDERTWVGLYRAAALPTMEAGGPINLLSVCLVKQENNRGRGSNTSLSSVTPHCSLTFCLPPVFTSGLLVCQAVTDLQFKYIKYWWCGKNMALINPLMLFHTFFCKCKFWSTFQK